MNSSSSGDAGLQPPTIPTLNDFQCPILRDVFSDPVVTCDGHSYERGAIEQWFSAGHRTSPKTNLPLPTTQIWPNLQLRAAIEAYGATLRPIMRAQKDYEMAVRTYIEERAAKESADGGPPGKRRREDGTDTDTDTLPDGARYTDGMGAPDGWHWRLGVLPAQGEEPERTFAEWGMYEKGVLHGPGSRFHTSYSAANDAPEARLVTGGWEHGILNGQGAIVEIVDGRMEGVFRGAYDGGLLDGPGTSVRYYRSGEICKRFVGKFAGGDMDEGGQTTYHPGKDAADGLIDISEFGKFSSGALVQGLVDKYSEGGDLLLKRQGQFEDGDMEGGGKLTRWARGGELPDGVSRRVDEGEFEAGEIERGARKDYGADDVLQSEYVGVFDNDMLDGDGKLTIYNSSGAATERREGTFARDCLAQGTVEKLDPANGETLRWAATKKKSRRQIYSGADHDGTFSAEGELSGAGEVKIFVGARLREIQLGNFRDGGLHGPGSITTYTEAGDYLEKKDGKFVNGSLWVGMVNDLAAGEIQLFQGGEPHGEKEGIIMGA